MFIFQMPSKIMAGNGCLDRLEEEIQKLGAEKVLVVAE
jgi:alcohol dehydrogenase class IV